LFKKAVRNSPPESEIKFVFINAKVIRKKLREKRNPYTIER
jgi:hypothetical protein